MSTWILCAEVTGAPEIDRSPQTQPYNIYICYKYYNAKRCFTIHLNDITMIILVNDDVFRQITTINIIFQRRYSAISTLLLTPPVVVMSEESVWHTHSTPTRSERSSKHPWIVVIIDEIFSGATYGGYDNGGY